LLTKDSPADFPELFLSMGPIHNLHSFWEVQIGNTLNPWGSIIDGTQPLHMEVAANKELPVEPVQVIISMPIQLDFHPLDYIEHDRADECIIDAGEAMGSKVVVQMGILAARLGASIVDAAQITIE
jgi:hypothetical protein